MNEQIYLKYLTTKVYFLENKQTNKNPNPSSYTYHNNI